MGDKFRKAQMENFKKGRDRELAAQRQPRLFERPELTKTIYHVQPDDGKACQPGENLLVILPDADGPPVVARGHEKIGIIEGEGGRVLKQALADRSSSGIAELRILSVSDMSGEATAEMWGHSNP